MRPAVNHWTPNPAVIAAIRKKHKARFVDFSTGLDTSVEYLTTKDVADRAGIQPKAVRYALAKEVGERGYLEAARRQPGRDGVLIHPDEADRWIEERRKRKEKQ